MLSRCNMEQKKKISKWLLPILGVVGVALLLFGGLLGSRGDTQKSEGRTYESYCAYEEARLQHLLEQVEGAGRVSVQITFSSGIRSDYTGSKLNEEETPQVLGVGVVCQGGNSDVVKQELIKLICAIYDIDSHKVWVVKRA